MSAPALKSAGERALIEMDREAIRPEPIARTVFAAWRVHANGTATRLDVTGATLAEVIANAAPRCAHKETFVVRETDGLSGRMVAHFYAVQRRSDPRYVYENHDYRRVHDLREKLLFSIQVSAFEPVEPFRWTPGCDVVGLDRSGIVDGSAA